MSDLTKENLEHFEVWYKECATLNRYGATGCFAVLGSTVAIVNLSEIGLTPSMRVSWAILSVGALFGGIALVLSFFVMDHFFRRYFRGVIMSRGFSVPKEGSRVPLWLGRVAIVGTLVSYAALVSGTFVFAFSVM